MSGSIRDATAQLEARILKRVSSSKWRYINREKNNGSGSNLAAGNALFDVDGG
jgi:hypothetical protein